MKFLLGSLFLICSLFAASALGSSRTAAAFPFAAGDLLAGPDLTTDDWVTFDGPPGADDLVSAIYIDDNDRVYIGGAFDAIGNSVHRGIAMWDGNAWQSLGSGVEGVGDVEVIIPDGNGGLFVGGTFRDMGGLPEADYLAHWDGAAWSALPGGFGSFVKTLYLATDGTLYVGGRFSLISGLEVNRIAAWDGSAWSALGGGLNDEVFAITEGPDGSIYAGGEFTNAGGDDDADGVARWDGASWSAVGPSFDPVRVRALHVYAADDIVVGGDFFDALGNDAADNVVRWNGETWEPLGDGLDRGVWGFGLDPAGNLLARGLFFRSGDANVSGVARWDGANWTTVARSLDFIPYYAFAFDSSGDLWIGGDFRRSLSGTREAMNRLAIWDGETFLPAPGVASGLSGDIIAVAVDAQGDVFVGGYFGGAHGDPDQEMIARWDGSTWHDVGGGLSSTVRALAAAPEGGMYVGGSFSNAGGDSDADRLAFWDGTAWSAVPGFVTDGFPRIRALTFDADGVLYVGGFFAGVAGLPGGNNIVCWDGETWMPLGHGLNDEVEAILVAPDGTVYAGGDFTDAGGDPDADGLARWDGTSWSAVGGPFQPFVSALAMDEAGDLYAAGRFSQATPVDGLNNIARWDGENWHPLGDGLNSNWTEALVFDDDGFLYAGGLFFHGPEFSPFAVWDGESWSTVAGGVSNYIEALAFDSATQRLYVGGRFGLAGGQPTSYFAYLQFGEGGEPDYLFANAEELGDSWRRLDWFGDFNDLGYPWIYHAEHGFLWTFDLSTLDSLYFFGLGGMGIVWTTQEIYPDVYFFEGGHGWTYYQGVVDGERLFTRYSDGESFTLPLAPLN